MACVRRWKAPCQHLTVTRVVAPLGVSWNTTNDAVLAEGRRILIDDERRSDGVKVIGVDEQVWRHTRRVDKCVTVITDLTGIREGTGPARLAGRTSVGRVERRHGPFRNDTWFKRHLVRLCA